jgi:hypothetical protein
VARPYGPGRSNSRGRRLFGNSETFAGCETVRLRALVRAVALELPAAPITVVQKLFRATHHSVRCPLHAECPADLIDDVLIG